MERFQLWVVNVCFSPPTPPFYVWPTKLCPILRSPVYLIQRITTYYSVRRTNTHSLGLLNWTLQTRFKPIALVSISILPLISQYLVSINETFEGSDLITVSTLFCSLWPAKSVLVLCGLPIFKNNAVFSLLL